MPAEKRRLSVAFPDLPEDAISAAPSWRDGLHSDWILFLGSHSFRVHKVVVGMGERRSLLLAAAFRKPCEEAAKTDLTEVIPEACHFVFEFFLDYIYGKDSTLTVANWAALMKIADVMQVPALHRLCVDACDRLMEAPVSMELCASAAECCLQEEVQVQIMQAAADVIAPQFSSAFCGQDGLAYKDFLLAQVKSAERAWALPLLVEVLSSDHLQVDYEDEVFNIVQDVGSVIPNSDARSAQLWECCRLEKLSREKLLQAVTVEGISKEAVVRAALYRAQEVDEQGAGLGTPTRLRGPRMTYKLQTESGTTANSIRLRIIDPLQYAQGQNVYSEWRPIGEGFRFRLSVFPSGTLTTANPCQVAVFVQVRPLQSNEEWVFNDVTCRVAVGNRGTGTTVIQRETYSFQAGCEDRGWHTGFVISSDLTLDEGWVDEFNALSVEATLYLSELFTSSDVESDDDAWGAWHAGHGWA